MISILYVDDEPVLLDLCRIFLERTGDFKVDTLESATGVPRLLEEKHYDAIIADYQMPEMDGITLLKTVRTQFGDIPFILFTGRGREEIVIEALNNGADFYLQKGGDARSQFTELAHKVRQAVSRQRAERDLRASEKRLYDIINFLPDPTFAIDREGHVIAWNRAIETLTGVAASEMLGKGNYEYSLPFYGYRRPLLIDLVFEPDDHINGHYSGIIREKDVLIAETDLPRPQGQPIVIMGKASPLYNPAGEIIGSIESIRDITTRKNAELELRSAYEEIAATEEELRGQFDTLALSEKSLRESEARFRQLSETTTASIFVVGKKILYANPAAETLTGYTREELGVMDFWEFVHPEFKEKVKDRGTRMPGFGERPSHQVFKILRKNGEVRWVDASTTRIHYAGTPAVLSIQVDITERKENEDALRSSRQFLANILENFPGVVFWKDNNFRYLGCNRNFAAGAGLNDPSEIIGKTDYDLPWARTEAEAYLEADRRVISGDVPFLNVQESQLQAGGKVAWFDTHKIPLLGPDGEVAGVLGTSNDITERKQVMDRLSRMNQMFLRFGPDSRANIGLITSLAGELLRGSCAFYHRLENDSLECIGHWNPPAGFTDSGSWEDRFFVDVIRGSKDEPVRITNPGSPASSESDPGSGSFPFKTYVGKTARIGDDYQGLLSVLYTDTVVTAAADLEFLTILANAIAIEDERWLAKESLMDSMEKYRGLFELGSEAIFLIDSETDRLLEANEAASEMYGYSHDELLSLKNMDLIAEQEIIEPPIKRPATGNLSIPLQYHIKKDGTVFPVEINGKFFIWSGRRVHVAAIHDITDRIRAEDALRRANKKLNLLNSINRHDVVNQLTVLQGYSQLALLREPEPVIGDFLAKIDAVSDTIARQLAFTGMYQELGVHAPGWHHLDDILSRVRPKEILFSSSCSNIEIFADPMLEMVFANLFDNAFRHGERVSRISIRCEPAGDDLMITVEDNGIGVPLDIKQKIFQKGFGKHTGFGLFLVREILAITGISIHETGKHGTGARFEIMVPKDGFRQGKVSRK
nr:PAS domain S-box protein [uncultured Methanoregula sp.]